MATFSLGNLPLEVSFDPFLIERAAQEVKYILENRGGGEATEEYLDALLTFLLFRRCEKQEPGTLARLAGMLHAAQVATQEEVG